MILRLLLFCSSAIGAFAQQRAVTDAEVMRVHRAALLIDTHNDTPSWIVDSQECGDKKASCVDLSVRSSIGHTDIPRLKEGGVGAVFFAAYVSGEYVKGNRSADRALAE